MSTCSNVTYGVFMATSCCIFGSLSCKYEKPIVVITTASGGSLVFLYGKLFVVEMKTVGLVKCVLHQVRLRYCYLCLGLDHFVKTSFSVAVESLVFRIKDVIFDGLRSEYTNWTYHATALTHYKALHFQHKG